MTTDPFLPRIEMIRLRDNAVKARVCCRNSRDHSRRLGIADEKFWARSMDWWKDRIDYWNRRLMESAP